MKIIGITSSPRKSGNTQRLVEHILTGAQEAGAKTELIRLCDFDIQPCTGCDVCKKDGECIIQDDMEEIYQKIKESDIVVFGSPIYWFRLSAQAYPFIDRIYGHFTPDFSCDMPKGKKIVVALTCGGEDIEDMNATNDYLKKVFQYIGFVDAGFIWQNNCNKPDDLSNYPEKIMEAKQLGKSLVP